MIRRNGQTHDHRGLGAARQPMRPQDLSIGSEPAQDRHADKRRPLRKRDIAAGVNHLLRCGRKAGADLGIPDFPFRRPVDRLASDQRGRALAVPGADRRGGEVVLQGRSGENLLVLRRIDRGKWPKVARAGFGLGIERDRAVAQDHQGRPEARMQQRPRRRSVEMPAHCHGQCVGERDAAAATSGAKDVDDQVPGERAFDRPQRCDHRGHARDGKRRRETLDAAVDDRRLVSRGIARRQDDQTSPERQGGDLRGGQQPVIEGIALGIGREHQGGLAQARQLLPDEAMRREMDDIEFGQGFQPERLFGGRLAPQQADLCLGEQVRHPFDFFRCFGQLRQCIEAAPFGDQPA